MSTTTRSAASSVRHDLAFSGIMRSEWIKLRTMRSTWWCYLALAAVTILLTAQMSAVLGFEGVPASDVTQEARQAMAAFAATTSADFTVLIVAVLGVLSIAGEYRTGMMATSLMTVPRRLPVLLGKALVFGMATFAVSAAAFAIGIPLSLKLLADNGTRVDLSDASYWLSLLSGVAYLTVIGLIAFSIGALVRSSAGGVAVALGLVLAAPLVLGLISGGAKQMWVTNIGLLLPTNLGKALFLHPGYYAFSNPGLPEEALPDGLWALEPWQGGLGLLAWLTVLLSAAAVLLKRRDA